MGNQDFNIIEGSERRIVIVARADGLFHYREDLFFPFDPETGFEASWVSSSKPSGIFLTADGAEAEARQCIPWLRGMSKKTEVD